MSIYWLIGLGSAVGGMLRYALTAAFVRLMGPEFPWGTIFINVTGSILIGALAAASGPTGRFPLNDDWRQFLMAGFCGGYTTFSAFSLQTLVLAEQGAWGSAAANVVGSVVLCLLGVWLGYQAGLALNR